MAKKILLADDSLTIQKVVELTFSDSDYDLICVSNGQKALDRIRDDRPDVVLADVVMPEKNGYEVCEAIKSNPATARIPVMLLSGTFEPFDRERAERIGADAIISKPFDSQQLIAQVEVLLDRAPRMEAYAARAPEAASTAAAAVEPARAEPVRTEPEEAPFDVGFSAEDFTAAVRMPPRGMDPFEEEYGREGVDSAIEAFERSRPQSPDPAPAAEVSPLDEHPLTIGAEDAQREPLAQWLGEEPDRSAQAVFVETSAPESSPPSLEVDESTVAIPSSLLAPVPAFQEAVSADYDRTASMKLPLPEAPQPDPDIPATDTGAEGSHADARLEPTAADETPRITLAPAPEPEEPSQEPEARTTEVPREIEMLAQTSSIPELTQMLSSVAKSAGGDLSDEQIDKLARRVVEKLSDRVVREIAWEVIPDLAEIVIKQRIKELEAGVE